MNTPFPWWKNAASVSVGAVTWCDGATGLTGLISAANSLVGSRNGDNVGLRETGYGNPVVRLTNGNYVVCSQNWDDGAFSDVGAVTWCSGNTGRTGEITVENSLEGTTAGDKISTVERSNPMGGGVVALANGNYAVCSARWDRGTLIDAGAVTWGDGAAGTTGRVSAENSVIGSAANDLLGSAVALTNGRYAVYSSLWNNGPIPDAGAVRLLDGDGPIAGELTAANALVGTTSGDQVSLGGVTALTNGNFVVASPRWANGALYRAGAATWINGMSGRTGPVTAGNSLTGATVEASVGGMGSITVTRSAINALTNGNYTVISGGAVTWGNGSTGTTGVVSTENSMLGLYPGDVRGVISGGVTALTDGGYLIAGPVWKNGTIIAAGAVTRCAGDGPTSGVASALNCIVGSHKDQYLGALNPAPLPDGGFVLKNPTFGGVPGVKRGAVVFGKGGPVIAGELSEANSVKGSETSNGGDLQNYAYDPVSGRLFIGLPADNKVVAIGYATPPASRFSLGFAGGAPVESGGTLNLDEVRLGSSRTVGVEIRNPGNVELVLDFAGSAGAEMTFGLPAGGTTLPPGGRLVVPLTFTPQQAGAATAVFSIGTNTPGLPEFTFTAAGNGSGTWPVLSTDLLPPAGSGRFGHKVVFLPNGNLVVTDPLFDASPSLADVGAVYLYSPAGTLISRVSGSTPGDEVGSGGIFPVGGGNFVIHSPKWSNSGALGAGAVTWASGTTGMEGVVSAENSLVGDRSGDALGVSYTVPGIPETPAVTVLPGGNYVVVSPKWHQKEGAITWGGGQAGVSGTVSATNSFVGTGGAVGGNAAPFGLTVLSNGNYVIRSSGERAGVTWALASTGVSGVISEENSLMSDGFAGSSEPLVTALTDGNFVTGWTGAGVGFDSVNAVLWSDGTTGQGSTGLLPVEKLLIDSTPGNPTPGAVTALPDGRYAVFNHYWNFGRGAVTVCEAGGITTGEVSAENSLVGVADTDGVGGGSRVLLRNGGLVMSHPVFDGERGAVTLIPAGSRLTGPVMEANSLVGLLPGDRIGSRGVWPLEDGNYVVASPDWSREFPGEGAVTWCNGVTGRTGSVSAANSLTGGGAEAHAGEGGITPLTGGKYVVCSPRWRTVEGSGSVGAVTWLDGDTEGAGVIHPGNSITGFRPGDAVGTGGVTRLTNGNYVVASPSWSDRRGAVTWADGFRPSAMTVSPPNSLVGGTSITDRIGGSNVYPPQPAPVIALANGHFLVVSAFWKNADSIWAGAVTWVDGRTGVSGEISAANSLTGTQVSQWLGSGTVLTEEDGSYALLAPPYRQGAYAGGLGIAVLGTGFGEFATGGFPGRRNSVLATNQVSGPYLDADYHAGTRRWAVGRGSDNTVTLFSFVPPDTGKIRLRQAGADVTGGSVIDFGSVAPGLSAERVFTLVNSGTQPLQIQGITVSGSGFSLQPSAPAGTLLPGMTATATLRFTPSGQGWQTAGLTVSSDDPLQPALTVMLRGLAMPSPESPFGTDAAAPQISVLSGGGVEVRFQAVPGVTYQLQRSLALAVWENRWLVTADDDGAVIFQDREATVDSSFYRLKVR